MQTALHLLILLIPYGGCTSGPTFTTEMTAVGQNASLECLRDDTTARDVLFWIRLVSGTFPEFLGHNRGFTRQESSKSGRRITVKQEPGKFVLQISQVQKSDTALYYCFLWTPWMPDVIFLKGIFLQVKDFPEAKTSVFAVTHDLLSDESRPGPSVTSRCSVVSRSGSKTCEDGHKVYWLRAGPEDSNPHFIYAHDECEKVAKGSMQKCVHAFHNNVDTGTYSCAVATCGHIFMANATKVIIKDGSKCDIVIFVLGSTSALSWIISAFLICKIMTKGCSYCKACRQTQEETCNGAQQRSEDTLVYSAPTIVARKSGKTRRTRTNEGFSTYTDVCLREA
ncbi:uncharacterized protein LOC133159107 isoform X1 [Syngnathus typhle]|uniref:uncharacterized protein LOC133159107 isoform X1 n=1 Tax=Syngnathus typhle TaxID=161592 RepID=UPI002A69A582|nr:uncharacterized protein LOC133159107 isoform X1 [Syngnathus typhle]